jgi:hypothetical protein
MHCRCVAEHTYTALLDESAGRAVPGLESLSAACHVATRLSVRTVFVCSILTSKLCGLPTLSFGRGSVACWSALSTMRMCVYLQFPIVVRGCQLPHAHQECFTSAHAGFTSAVVVQAKVWVLHRSGRSCCCSRRDKQRCWCTLNRQPRRWMHMLRIRLE